MKRTPAPEAAVYYLAGFLAAALWGVMSLSLRQIQAWSAVDVFYYRVLVSALAIWPTILLFRRKQWRADVNHLKRLPAEQRRRMAGLTLLASLLIMGNWFTFIYAVNRISVQSAAFAYMVCPLLTTLLGFLLLKESLSPLKKIALLIALVSVMMLMQGSFFEVVWSLIVALFYALYLIVQRVIKQVDKLNLLAVQIGICSLIIVPVFIAAGTAWPTAPVFWWNIGLIAVVFTIVPLFLSMYALNGLTASTTGILLYINPIMAFLLAVFYFKEEVDAVKVLAYAVLLVAIILFNWEFIRVLLRTRSNKRNAHG